MKANIMNNVKVFANEFVSTIMEGNEQSSSGYEWQISYYRDNDEEEGKLNTKVLLSLYDGDGVGVCSIIYDIVKNIKSRYTYTTTFLFEEVTIGDNEAKEFEEIKNAIDMCEEGLFDKICAYLHKCAMEQMYNDEDLDYGWPPTYEIYYSPSRIESFMKTYGISPYVPIDIEVVDNKGMPIRYLSIKSVNFNDESNSLLILMNE